MYKLNLFTNYIFNFKFMLIQIKYNYSFYFKNLKPLVLFFKNKSKLSHENIRKEENFHKPFRNMPKIRELHFIFLNPDLHVMQLLSK